MVVRSIPPKTMMERLRERGDERRPETGQRTGAGDKRGEGEAAFKVFRKPKEWVYETRPQFRKLSGPLIDVFKEAEEVRIVIELSGFKRGEVDIDIKPDRYVITAQKGEQAFREEIQFPKDVDVDSIEERFKNGILELVLPRKKPREAEE